MITHRVLVSGGFDPLHAGHVDMLKTIRAMFGVEAFITVAINSDKWLLRKKGYVVMPWEERAEIVGALKPVNSVVKVIDTDDTVIKTLESLKPHFFVNSGDRTPDNIPEREICERLGIRSVWIDTTRNIHSSDIINNILNSKGGSNVREGR